MPWKLPKLIKPLKLLKTYQPTTKQIVDDGCNALGPQGCTGGPLTRKSKQFIKLMETHQYKEPMRPKRDARLVTTDDHLTDSLTVANFEKKALKWIKLKYWKGFGAGVTVAVLLFFPTERVMPNGPLKLVIPTLVTGATHIFCMSLARLFESNREEGLKIIMQELKNLEKP